LLSEETVGSTYLTHGLEVAFALGGTGIIPTGLVNIRIYSGCRPGIGKIRGGCCTEHLEEQRKNRRNPKLCEQPDSNGLPGTHWRLVT
jgi:hypothetical protein